MFRNAWCRLELTTYVAIAASLRLPKPKSNETLRETYERLLAYEQSDIRAKVQVMEIEEKNGR